MKSRLCIREDAQPVFECVWRERRAGIGINGDEGRR